jgi:energy-coupling factor transporter ATP-binding protein EcfA2
VLQVSRCMTTTLGHLQSSTGAPSGVHTPRLGTLLSLLCNQLWYDPGSQGLSFSVGKGEVLFIKGPSGVGKSLLLRALAHLDRPVVSQAGWLSRREEREKIACRYTRLTQTSSLCTEPANTYHPGQHTPAVAILQSSVGTLPACLPRWCSPASSNAGRRSAAEWADTIRAGGTLLEGTCHVCAAGAGTTQVGAYLPATCAAQHSTAQGLQDFECSSRKPARVSSASDLMYRQQRHAVHVCCCDTVERGNPAGPQSWAAHGLVAACFHQHDQNLQGP